MAAPRNTFTLKVDTNSLFAAINIQKAVEKMEGVEKVETNPQQRRVVITGTVRPDKVIATLHNNLGIKAELSPPTSIRPPPSASKFTLKVDTNSLFGAINIQKVVEKMEGVEKVETNPQQRRVVITGTVRPDEVIATLHNNLGIKAELSPPTSIRPTPSASKFTLKVDTNSLFGAINIQKVVEKMEGVEKVETNPQQRRVVITGTVRPDEVIATLHNNLGIKAELSPPTSIRPTPSASKFTLKVDTNSLFGAINIQKVVEKMEGVEKVETNPQQRRVVITGTVRPDEVIATLHNNLGIKAELSPPTSIRPPPPPAVPSNGSQIVVGQSSNAINPLLGDLNKVAQDVGQLRMMVPGLAGVKISNQIVSESIEFSFNSN
nr:heavy metal-associated isoprenylated plant protein 9-like [Ipomoea trifida]